MTYVFFFRKCNETLNEVKASSNKVNSLVTNLRKINVIRFQINI